MKKAFVYFLFLVFPSFIFSQEKSNEMTLTFPDNKPFYYLDSEGNSIDRYSCQDSLRTGRYNISVKEEESEVKMQLLVKFSELSQVIGKQLPETEMTDINQNKIYLGDKGLSMLNFWDVTCLPCIERLTVFDILAKEYPEVRFVAITTDSLQNVKQFMQEKGLKWDNLFIVTDYKESQFNLFGVNLFPHNIIIDNARNIKSVCAEKPIRYIVKTLENIEEEKRTTDKM